MNISIKNQIKKIITTLISVLVVVMMLLVGYLMLCNIGGKVPYIGKYSTVKIISQSMEPTIPVGTYILVKKTDPQTIKVDDVILFVSRDPSIYGKINTHRVCEINEVSGQLYFVTKGDNNPSNDQFPVPQSDLVGKYIKNIPFLTKFANWFSNPTVFFIFVVLPAAALIIISVYDIVKKSKELKMDLLVKEEVNRLKQAEGKVNEKEGQ